VHEILLRTVFAAALRQSGTKLRTRCFPDFVLFLRSLFLNTVSRWVSVSVTDLVSHPYKTTDDITCQGYVFVLA